MVWVPHENAASGKMLKEEPSKHQKMIYLFIYLLLLFLMNERKQASGNLENCPLAMTISLVTWETIRTMEDIMYIWIKEVLDKGIESIWGW